MRHNFSDDTWGAFAQDFNLLRPLEDVIVEHRHHLFGKAKKDATYDRGSSVDFDTDKALYTEWRGSEERREQSARIASLLGGNFSVLRVDNIRLMICVPIQDTEVDIGFHQSLNETERYLTQRRIVHGVQYHVGGSHIGKAREATLWGALKTMPDATHLCFIDADMGWKPKLITRLLATDHDFAAVSGVKKTDIPSVCFNGLPDVMHPVTKFMRIRHVGFAFVMLKRCVIEFMCNAYPELEYNTEGNGREWALFLDLMWKQAGHDLPERLSEDFSFCERWCRIGGEIWLDPHASIIHAGRKGYTGSPAEILGKGNAAA